MHVRILPAIAVGSVAAALAISYSPAAGAKTAPSTAHRVTVQVAVHTNGDPEKPCKGANQRDNDSGIGVVSQNFESPFDQYDSQAADDFTLQKKCLVSDVAVDGIYFNGSGPADSVNVIFYHDTGSSAPGKVFLKCLNQSYTDSAFGSFVVDFEDAGCITKDKRFKPGTYWVSVQANMDFSSGGEWGWNTNNTVRGDASMWQNPGDGFGTGCTSWTTTTTCIPSGEGADLSFAVLK